MGWAGGKGCELHIFLLGTTSFFKKLHFLVHVYLLVPPHHHVLIHAMFLEFLLSYVRKLSTPPRAMRENYQNPPPQEYIYNPLY